MSKLVRVLGASVVRAGCLLGFPPAPATPRIQPPFLVGATPGAPFLYAVPATGQSPLAFAATGSVGLKTLSDRVTRWGWGSGSTSCAASRAWP